MNYYEELGARPEASAEEIRQAFKVLARLLHPDGQTDEKLKAMAECQMKRLNEVVSILTDPQRRREYDESLLVTAVSSKVWPLPAHMPRASRLAPDSSLTRLALRHWFSMLIGVLMLGVGLWCAMQKGPSPVAAIPESEPSPAAGPGPEAAPSRQHVPQRRALPASEPSQDKSDDTVRATAAPAPESVGTLFETVLPHFPPGTAVLPSPPGPAPEITPAAAGPAAAEPGAPPPPATSLAGNWFYSPDAAEKADSGRYPATYVELLLQEDDNGLRGSYRAKYNVPNQAISSEVVFRLQGKSEDGKSANVSWTSADGARGQGVLTLLSPNQMTVNWWTTAFLARAALASGSAVLVRQQRHR